MPDQMIVVLITVPSIEVGRQIADTLLEKKLAACVNFVSPVRSLYTWQGALQDDEEVLLLVKSRAELFESRLLPAVLQAHPYEVPEVIALPILMGSQPYLDWIQEATSE